MEDTKQQSENILMVPSPTGTALSIYVNGIQIGRIFEAGRGSWASAYYSPACRPDCTCKRDPKRPATDPVICQNVTIRSPLTTPGEAYEVMLTMYRGETTKEVNR